MKLPEDKMLILFDGVCNLCNSSVLYVIKRDKKDQYRFASLQSEMGQEFVRQRGIDTNKTDSIILFEPGIAYYTKSAAALKIGKSFGGLWKLLALFEWIPTPIGDFFYDLVAKNRYRWFGKRDSCMVPTADLEAKFVG